MFIVTMDQSLFYYCAEAFLAVTSAEAFLAVTRFYVVQEFL